MKLFLCKMKGVEWVSWSEEFIPELMPVFISITWWISMCNQMVTSEIREYFHARFVQILIISQVFTRGRLLGFGQNASEIIP